MSKEYTEWLGDVLAEAEKREFQIDTTDPVEVRSLRECFSRYTETNGREYDPEETVAESVNEAVWSGQLYARSPW